MGITGAALPGGRSFTPIPFMLGTNGHMISGQHVDTAGIAWAQQIGMKVYRCDVGWTAQGIAIEGKPGVYIPSEIAWAVTVAAAIRAAGMIPLFVLGVNQNPGTCPTLNSPLVSGTTYNSVTLTALPFAIASGDPIEIITPSNQSQNQTVTATAAMAAGASGVLTTSSFVANSNYADGCWMYDTNWVACTPQHAADAMVHLVSTAGLQGIHWEIFNEPDGGGWHVDPNLLAQTFQLAYGPMKAADPTCIIHGICGQHCSQPGDGDGQDYYNACVAAGILGHYDIVSMHDYNNNNTTYVTDRSPDDIVNNIWTRPMWRRFAEFQANKLAKGDNTPMWITELNWPWGNSGQMTPQLQANFLQTLLAELSGYDPINKVQFSEYIKVLCIYEQTGTDSGGNWGLIPNDLPPGTGNPVPAVAILTTLVNGGR